MKSHPLRRAVLATAATVSGIVLLLSLKPGSDPASAGSASDARPAPSVTATVEPSAAGAAEAAGVTTVTGDATTTQYGVVQVRLTVRDGRITMAQAVRAPSGGRSDQVSAMAVPKLNQEAVAAGSADIDAVSGATYTSGGYKKSLQSALDRAKARTAPSGAAGATGSPSAGGGPAKPPAARARTVTGRLVQTDYGPVQVRVTVSGGRITKAEAVRTPTGGRSDQVTAMAVPTLNKEAVAAGSADIDAVSGATYTSGGYKKSLQSALDQAGV
ncbi:FMN-binding protein [Streptomyces sp. NPDC090306]|uniref:FMN-binding protein n=1 Tax=unclassified Streptomyces TaxID=2593676 RepID=UPI0036E08F52